MCGVTQPRSYRGTKNNADVVTEVLAATEKGENAKITENYRESSEARFEARLLYFLAKIYFLWKLFFHLFFKIRKEEGEAV